MSMSLCRGCPGVGGTLRTPPATSSPRGQGRGLLSSTSPRHTAPPRRLLESSAPPPAITMCRARRGGGGGDAGGDLSRRDLLAAGSIAWGLWGAPPLAAPALAAPLADDPPPLVSIGVPDYTQQGPFIPKRLPRLEHTCTTCFPMCSQNACLVKVDVTYPGGASQVPAEYPYTPAPFPMAIFSSGFLIGSEKYRSYAQRLASWGYVCIQYDTFQTIAEPLTDDLLEKIVRDLIDWAGTDVTLKQLCDTERVLLAGHSRGGKVSTLAASKDSRVKAVALIDPVDNTVYAPLGPGYPSAVAALKQTPTTSLAGGWGAGEGREAAGPQRDSPLPVAVVGSRLGGDCAPKEANYNQFFGSAMDAAWAVEITDSGHFQFLDNESVMETAVCARGGTGTPVIREAALAVMTAWAEVMVAQRFGELRPGRGGEGAGVAPGGGGGAANNGKRRPAASPPAAVATNPLGITLVEVVQQTEASIAAMLREDPGGKAAAVAAGAEGAEAGEEGGVEEGEVLKSRLKFGPVTGGSDWTHYTL